ncbi:MAG: LysR family transcriptional regulator [Thermodesulfobacteriota bacterium]
MPRISGPSSLTGVGVSMSVRLRCKVWLENEAGKPIIGEGRLRILTAVRLTGSISKAAQKLNLPFRNVWAKIKDAERQSGLRIVERTRTGSRLTAEGEALMSRFAELQRSCERSAHAKFKRVFSDGGREADSPETAPVPRETRDEALSLESVIHEDRT